jgi:hypothetical protein
MSSPRCNARGDTNINVHQRMIPDTPHLVSHQENTQTTNPRHSQVSYFGVWVSDRRQRKTYAPILKVFKDSCASFPNQHLRRSVAITTRMMCCTGEFQRFLPSTIQLYMHQVLDWEMYTCHRPHSQTLKGGKEGDDNGGETCVYNVLKT